MKNKFLAFTLAEVLITLVIIGVIAAMVIPNLWQRHFEAEMISKFKKNMSVLNNALAQAVRENGPTDEWLANLDTGQKARKIYENLKPYLKVQKECGKSTGCFASSYKALLSNTLSEWNDVDSRRSANPYRFILEDGTAIHIQQNRVVFIDLNGNKGPNRMGVDMFFLRIREQTIVPAGYNSAIGNEDDAYSCALDSDAPKNGALCGAWIMTKGNMDYLHRDISDEWPQP